jgi:hypothetical protein
VSRLDEPLSSEDDDANSSDNDDETANRGVAAGGRQVGGQSDYLDDEPATLENFWRIQTRFFQLPKIIDEIYFDEVMQGVFVKIKVAQISKDVSVYRMAEVVAVERNMPKYFDQKLGKALNHRLLVTVGGRQMQKIKYELISNHRITPDEFEFYQKAVAKSGGHMLTSKEVRYCR